MTKKNICSYLLIIVFSILLLTGCSIEGNRDIESDPAIGEIKDDIALVSVELDKEYNHPEEVAAYIHSFQQLPPNYITKKEAIALGWKSQEGNLWEVAGEKTIGGDIFGNREGLLPKFEDRVWRECDVNYDGGLRGSERIVYSNDGLIYYTNDHYASFTQLY